MLVASLCVLTACGNNADTSTINEEVESVSVEENDYTTFGTMDGTFLADDDQRRIVGDIYLPDDYQEGEKLDTIIMCHGYGGTRLTLNPYAEYFAC